MYATFQFVQKDQKMGDREDKVRNKQQELGNEKFRKWAATSQLGDRERKEADKIVVQLNAGDAKKDRKDAHRVSKQRNLIAVIAIVAALAIAYFMKYA
jgi:hypothetical protein